MFLAFKANLLACFLLEGLKFFLPWVWSIFLNILLRFFISPHPSLIPLISSRNGKGQGRGNIVRVKFPFLDPNTFSLGNNTSAEDPDLQKELPRVHFIKAASDWKGWREGVFLPTILFTCKISAHLPGPG